jgi:hypothetical protein
VKVLMRPKNEFVVTREMINAAYDVSNSIYLQRLTARTITRVYQAMRKLEPLTEPQNLTKEEKHR